jgi:arachidonate 15-lipoxygenase
VKTLPGVPLAASVPFADEPSVPWLIATLDVAIPVVENAICVKLAERGAAAANDPDLARLDEIRKVVDRLRDLHDGKEEGGIRGLLSSATGTVGALAGTHARTLRGHIDELRAMVAARGLTPKAVKDLAAFEALFIKLPLPAIAKKFAEDETFARMRVAGPNAVLIQRVTSVPANFPITDVEYLHGMRLGPGDDSIAQAIADRRLYLLDYAGLATMVPGTVNGHQKYLDLPLALFAVPPKGRSLQVVAIRLGQEAATAPLHLRPAPGAEDWAWEMAKFQVQVADGNYHEIFAHLARTHLVVEAAAVAMHRALSPEHPLFLLLVPHVEGTVFINNEAAGGLIAAGGPIEQLFAGTIDTIQLAAVQDRLGFDFTAQMLPTELAGRGVDDVAGLPDYPYRDDGLLVWHAIERWVRAYVGVYYSGDEDVIGDTELAAFCAELRGQGRLRGFPVIQSIDTLVSALTMIIFTGSAQHAAVNFPQQTDMTWVPNVTGSAWAPGADSPGPKDESTWFAMMPTVDLALLQLNTLWVLGGVHFRKLGDYLSPDFPYHAWFLDPKVTRDGGPLEAFRNDLRAVEAQVEKNNAGRTVPYTFLLPSLIPQSINI